MTYANRVVLGASAMLALAAAVAGCRHEAPPPPPPQAAAIDGPALGEIMSLQQMRHTKLWLAGSAKNWPLADYEIDELREGFDAVVKYHPTHKDSPVDPKDAIPLMALPPLADLKSAVEKKDPAAFAASYDALTQACNACHEATNFGFNVVQRPTSNPYPNQVFTPKGK